MTDEIICGVYKITNATNNKFYIGSTRNIYNRWRIHKKELNSNTHCNPHLQKSWDKHGEINFIFEILDVYKKPFWAGKKEQLYLDEHVGTKDCYNINKFVCWISESTRRKLSKSNKGKMTQKKAKNHSVKMKKYWSSDRSLDHRQKITDSLRVTYASDKMKKKLSKTVKQSHIDKPRSEESRLKNSESNRVSGLKRWERDRDQILE
jgi:group I intron endonuclease